MSGVGGGLSRTEGLEYAGVSGVGRGVWSMEGCLE